MTHDPGKSPFTIPLDQLRERATAVAEELKGAADVQGPLRARFIEVRSALFQRGIYDPVLVRFDSATAPKATAQEIADQLAAVAQSL